MWLVIAKVIIGAAVMLAFGILVGKTAGVKDKYRD